MAVPKLAMNDDTPSAAFSALHDPFANPAKEAETVFGRSVVPEITAGFAAWERRHRLA